LTFLYSMYWTPAPGCPNHGAIGPANTTNGLTTLYTW
jgi:hypothetical protein